MRKLLSICMLIATVAIMATGATVRITESPGRGKRTVEVGDMFYINIEVSDIEAKPETPKSVPGAKVMYFERTGQASSFSSVNGRTTQSFSYTYTMTLRATKEGTYTYGPISVGGVKSNQIKYTIGAGGNAPSSQSSQQSASPTNQGADDKPKYIGKGDGNLFLRANVSSTTAYEQQALVYTVKLYTTYDAIKFIGASAAPKFDGFVVEESKDISNSLNYETYQGKTYATAIIARYIIFPQMTGSLKVTGNTYTVSVDRREYYHDPFFGNMSYSTPLQLNVTPNDLVINVRELPAPKPADFSGAVGTFRISSKLNTNSFRANQAASIIYTVEGTGNIKYLQLPDLSALYPSEIEVYSPKTTPHITVGSTNVSGTMTFDYSFMPLEEGEFAIPDVKLIYFNPQSGKYETSVARGYKIKVGKGAPGSENANGAKTKFDAQLQNVEVDSLSKHHPMLVRSWWYWLLYIVPIILYIVAFATYRKYVNSHADMVAFNSRRANKIAARRLKKAAIALKKHDRENFYTELLSALWGYLSDKLKMPTSELMRENVRQVLSTRRVPEAETDAFIHMIDEAEFAKYSSAGTDSNMQKAYDNAVEMINRLENAFKKEKDGKSV